MQAKASFKGSILILFLLLIGLGLRIVYLSDSNDPMLHAAVRNVLWSTYSGVHLSSEIRDIRDNEDYDRVEGMTTRASPEAIQIEEISRSQPIMTQSTNQTVVVKVRYRFPDESTSKIQYMKFKRGSLVDVWSYEYEVYALSYYLNFF